VEEKVPKITVSIPLSYQLLLALTSNKSALNNQARNYWSTINQAEPNKYCIVSTGREWHPVIYWPYVCDALFQTNRRNPFPEGIFFLNQSFPIQAGGL
jgi:hypothetical protein